MGWFVVTPPTSWGTRTVVSDMGDILPPMYPSGMTASAAIAPDIFRTGAMPTNATLAFDRVGVGESCGAGLLVDAHPGTLQIVAQQRVPACVRGHVPDTRQQPGVVERGFAARDPVERELPGLADQPRGLSERADRYGPVVRGHPPELVPGDQRGAGAETGRAERRDDPSGSGADDHDVEWLRRR